MPGHGGRRVVEVPPPPSVLAAYGADPSLAVLHLDLREALEVALTSALLGVLPRD
ncbi:hypothetical protein [Cellulomonas xiejunii]|uniref:Uncharacterized protein n=1 Tax=Cellulomonas xiejunii TaxID=2968083 RepID=A0ABY5KN96_9CELL|nr:hypothetical protein [Cellulomonas xiejunii]MCC2321169.1 hypothetical protein [Cellulomonas xiejunii]UUI71759.1 hypothetical protein NP048_18540 [Cellulomonas xiejunii]